MINSHNKWGIYIHIPFCIKKCHYCDFYSIPVREKSWLARYTGCLLREIGRATANSLEHNIDTVYLGGGTPSLLSPEQIYAVIEALQKKFRFEPYTEISMEANPYHHDYSALKLIKEAGINRLSFGAQSFNDNELKILGRIHNRHDVIKTVEAAHKAGFSNINLDLIYGIPGQSLKQWEKNLRMAVDCGPQHISVYLLQLDEQTPLAQRIARHEIKLLGEDAESQMYYTAVDYLQGQGFNHYEISNFAKEKYECRHNLHYWNADEYLGFGVGAVTFVRPRRTINQPPVEDYMEQLEKGMPCRAEVLEVMDNQQLLADAIILGLRLTRGINRKDFQKHFGVDLYKIYGEVIEKCVEDKLLNSGNGTIALTGKGYFLANEVLYQFIT